jgi:hypothetical protein
MMMGKFDGWSININAQDGNRWLPIRLTRVFESERLCSTQSFDTSVLPGSYEGRDSKWSPSFSGNVALVFWSC